MTEEPSGGRLRCIHCYPVSSMRVLKPSDMVDVCDFCKREGFLVTCDVCEREFCLTCEGTVGQSWGFTRLCRECASREDVQEICRKYADQLTPIYQKRKAALKRLGERIRQEANA